MTPHIGKFTKDPKRARGKYHRFTLEEYLLNLIGDALSILLSLNRQITRDGLRRLIVMEEILYKHLLSITGQDKDGNLDRKIKMPPK